MNDTVLCRTDSIKDLGIDISSVLFGMIILGVL